MIAHFRHASSVAALRRPIVIIATFRGVVLPASTPNSPSAPAAKKSAPGGLRQVAKSVARKLVPSVLLQHVLAWRSLDSQSRNAYARLLWLRTLGRRRPVLREDAPAPRVVMFVCFGNIIRSAFAEALLRAELERTGIRDIEVISSGTDARNGREADRRAIALAPEFGVSLEQHRATLVTSELMDRCDAVFAMDFLNEAKLASRFPQALPKILLLTPVSTEPPVLAIPDPYMGDAESVRACYGVLQRRIRMLADQLARSPRESRAYSGNVLA
ncbi:MAG: hypothetical protein AB7O65_07720 [Candidatus Korobacteraceae bacterium]